MGTLKILNNVISPTVDLNVIPSIDDTSTFEVFKTDGVTSLFKVDALNEVSTFGVNLPVGPNILPTTDTEIANKKYVDSVASGLTPKASVRVATTTALPACTYSGTPNFTLTGNSVGQLADIDSVTLSATNRLLVKDQADAKQNGIYEVTVLGNGGAAFVLTRTSDYNSTAEVKQGTFTFAEEGSTNGGHQFIQLTVSPTLDTNDLVFGVLYAPVAETLDSVTDNGATTTNAISVGTTTAPNFISTAILGTQPLACTSTTLNTNFNADLLDGQHGSYYASSVKTIVVKTSAYVVTSTDDVIVCNSATAFTLTLPIATGSSKIFYIKNINTGLITVDGNGAETIDGELTQEVGDSEAMVIIDYAVGKWIIV